MKLLATLALVLAAAAPARGQEPERVRILSARAEPSSVKVGEVFHVFVRLEIDDGWHVYAAEKGPSEYRSAWTVEAPAGRAGPVVEPGPKHHRQELGKMVLEYDYHEGSPEFRIPVRLGQVPEGRFVVRGLASGQVCADVCIGYELPFEAPVQVLPGGEPVAPDPPPPPPAAGAQDAAQREAQKELEKRGLIGFLFLGMLGGLISLVMPCTYPLIPITLTYFLKQGGESRGKTVLLSSLYALGIIVSFTAIGFLLTVILGEDGPRLFAADPIVNGVFGALFLYFAFSLFGLYEIRLPSFLTGATASPHAGAGGAFVLGLLFSLVTFTCTIPIAGTILGVAASSGTGHKLIGLFTMFVYSFTMAVPFFLIGLFPALLGKVPRSGGWLQTIKITTGLAELALALSYFAKADQVLDIQFLTRTTMIFVWVISLFLMGLYLLGLFRLKDDSPQPHVGVTRIVCALLFGVLSLSLLNSPKHTGFFDIFLPAYIDPEGKFATLPDAEKEARRTGKPIFVEFTGVT